MKRLIKENQSVKTRQICSCFCLHRQGFDCFKCNDWGSIYLFFYERCWSSCRNSKCRFHSNFFSNNRNSTTRNKKKKHDKIFLFAKSKLSSIETLISQALIDMEISHEEFVTILKEKDRYEKMKENLRSENEKYEIMRLSSIKSRT